MFGRWIGRECSCLGPYDFWTQYESQNRVSQTENDRFPEKARNQIAKRSGWLCSVPCCRKPTVASGTTMGDAAHISSKAPRCARYDASLTSDFRKSPENGIWLCSNHHRIVDSTPEKFTIGLLREWKADAEAHALRLVQEAASSQCPKSSKPSRDELSASLRAAAAVDLEVFRRLASWPRERTTQIRVASRRDKTIGPRELAELLTTLGDLVLVGEPGIGKTTTVFQVAEAAIENEYAIPLIVRLGDWSTEESPLVKGILERPAFANLTEDHLHDVAARLGVALLLDGWNELDRATRRKARTQIARLEAEQPNLSILITTRNQKLDVPIGGIRADLCPLSEVEQIDMARSLDGTSGERCVEQAWAAGLRELTAIPLYLNTMVLHAKKAGQVTTKEKVMRSLVSAYETDVQRDGALGELTGGMHERFLIDLAVTAIREGSTALTEHQARKSISQTASALESEGQITQLPQPDAAIGALIGHHVLVQLRESAGCKFHHHQIQEWYASQFVERLMLGSITDAATGIQLKAEVFNQRSWEESILFACERIAHNVGQGQDACAKAILGAFEVDPMLAAEMVYRSTDEVWQRISREIQSPVSRWHIPGKVDRALRFMIRSGRHEFLDYVWPLITHEDIEVRYHALRVAKCFRVSILGDHAVDRVKALPTPIRRTVIEEIAFSGDYEGLRLVTSLAQVEVDPEVKASAAEALDFRGASQALERVLKDADERTIDLLAGRAFIDGVMDERAEARLVAARERLREKASRNHEQISRFLRGPENEAEAAELETVIAKMDLNPTNVRAVDLLHRASRRFPEAVSEGILRRIRHERSIPFGPERFLAGNGLAYEDESLVKIALSPGRSDGRGRAVVRALGPGAIGRLIDRLFEL